MNIVTKIIHNTIFKLKIRTFHKAHLPWSSWLHSKMQGWFNIHRSINKICYANERGRNNLFLIYAKSFDKIHHSFLNQVETQNKRNTFKQNKGKLGKKPYRKQKKHYFTENSRKIKAFLLKSETSLAKQIRFLHSFSM